jgi:hypothetical protein
MATAETAWKKSDGPVRYHGGGVAVELGDRVQVRGWFRTRLGSVNYVPGISPEHEEMEHNLLYWTGVAMDDGTFTGVLVDPDTGRTRKLLVFVERGSMESVTSVPRAPFE